MEVHIDPAQGATFNEGSFNTLLNQLNATVNQVAELYYRDVEAALKENEKLRLELGDTCAGSHANSKSGRRVSFSETSASLWETGANDIILNEIELRDCSPSAPPESDAQWHSQDEALLQSVESGYPDSTDWDSASAKLGAASQSLPLVKLMRSEQRHKTKGVKYYRMRSPWADFRHFERITLHDVMGEDWFTSSQAGENFVGKMRLTSVELLAQQKETSPCFIVHPESRVRGYWMLACIVLLVYDFIVVPVDVCFDLKETKFSKAMDIFSAIFWTVDIVFTFFVGVRLAHHVENRLDRIACNYFKSWFAFDIFLVIPEWITLGMPDQSFSGGQVSVIRIARWGRFMRLLRMARFLRIAKFKPLMRRLVYILNLSKAYIHLTQTLAGLTIGLLAFVHIASCMWYAIGYSSDNGWVSVNGLRSASVGPAYAASLHWSFSRLHGVQSYNTIEAVSELFLDAMLMYVSLLLAALYNGTVAALAMTSGNAQSFNLWKLSVLFIKRHQISSGLDMKMVRFLESSGVGGAVEAAAEEQMLLESLPKTLRQDLLFEARLPYMLKKPYIKHLLAANSRLIRQICTEAVAQRVYVDGEVVFAKGDACDGMFFVMSGRLYYILDTPDESLATIQEKLFNPIRMGSIRGVDSTTKEIKKKMSLSEPALWTQWEHKGSLLTIEESTSLLMSPSDFSQVITAHADVLCYTFKYARHFLWKLNETEGKGVDDLIAFDWITVHDLAANFFEGTEYDHFMFLSHYKVEAGTEATLMREALQDMLKDEPNHPANDFRSPIFVDSEDLTDLSRLKEHVKGSDALVLLLTPGVLSRPWCLVEIVTAIKHDVNIVPVDIQRPGSKYKYPDEMFYASIRKGLFLDQEAVDLLEIEGISLLDVEKSIRQVFLKIALPFSPHKSKKVREAELHDVLARSTPDKDQQLKHQRTMPQSRELSRRDSEHHQSWGLASKGPAAFNRN